MAKKQLTKSRDKVMSGVLGGFAEYFSIDATLLRIIFATAAVFFFHWLFCISLQLWLCLNHQATIATSTVITMIAKTSHHTVTTTTFNAK